MLVQIQNAIHLKQTEIAAIKAQGKYRQGVTLQQTTPAGTARVSKDCKYYQLRAEGRTAKLPNGRRTQYVPLKDVARIRAEVERGRAISFLEDDIKALQQQAAKLQAAIARLTG